MKILHTADWHLGHSLHEQGREEEHTAFLDWLLELVGREKVDALLVAGDVFDSANPSAAAQTLWYGFLAELCKKHPQVGVVVIAGNHDSAARLEAPEPLLRRFGIHVVGEVSRLDGEPELERLVVPLRRWSGEVAARVVALPFLRPADLTWVEEEEQGDPLVEGVRRLYARAIEEARRQRADGEAIVALGHCYMVGGSLSELSERKVLCGNQHALPADIFPADVAYVALGHLHLAQRVGGREQVRYSGSVIPLSMAEAGYRHQVLLVQLDGERLASVREIPVPRRVPLLRLPEEGFRPLEDVVSVLRAAELPPSAELAFGERPLLEVRVALERPEPALRRTIEDALEGRGVRLLRIAVQQGGSSKALGDQQEAGGLDELGEEQVFRRRYAQKFDGEVPPSLLAGFHELLEEARRQLQEVER